MKTEKQLNQNSQRESEEEVLRMLRDEDPRAAQALLDVFGDRVYGLCLRILSSMEDASEVVQETFLKVWEKWPTFKGSSRFSSWIYRIAANNAYMRLRRRKRFANEVSFEQLDRGTEQVEADVSHVSSGKFSTNVQQPDEAVEQMELRSTIEEAVNSLSPTYRTAFILKDIEGMSLKDIAEVMSLSEAAVKSRVHRARLAMRQKLDRVHDQRSQKKRK